ncbi:MAG: sodium/proline symporter [Pseudomonadota bacterium]
MSVAMGVFVAYLFILIGLALWSRRESQSLDGFYLAGKKLPFWVVAFSTNATGESGWLLLGLTAMGFTVGAQAYWVAVGEVLGVWLAWTLVSRRMKRLSDETGSITVPDVLSAYFRDEKHVLRTLAVLIILVMVGVYVTAQIVAAGKALSTFSTMTYSTAAVVGAIVIIAYTFVGGYKAVAYTDVIQGVLMLLGLIIVPIVAINAAGGWQSVSDTLTSIDPNLLDMFSITDTGAIGWIALFSFVAIGLPFLGVPQLMVRFMSAKSEQELVKAKYMSVFVILLFDIGAVTAGMAGRALFPDLADADVIFPLLSRELFPAIITGVLMVIVLSAIMSTVDSLLLLASSAVVRDGFQKILGSTRSNESLTKIGKVVTVLIGVSAIPFAIKAPEETIFWFALFAWSGLGAAFGPVILCMLYFKKTNLPGAVAGMLVGFTVTMVWIAEFKKQTHDLYEMIPGFFVGLFVTIVVSLLTQKASAPPTKT